MTDDLPILLDMVNDVLMTAERQQGETFSGELRQALNALAMHPEANEARPQIAARLQYLQSPIGTGFLSVWLGAGVENGLDPENTALPLLEVFLKWTRTIETVLEDERAEVADGDSDSEADSEADVNADPPADPKTLMGLERMGQGLVAHLSRTPKLTARLSRNDAVTKELDRVSHLSLGALWVLELLRKRSGSLVVIHGTELRGFRLAYEHLSNCFHLFTLLQGSLAGKMPGARHAKAEVLSVARGESSGEVSDTAWWHYGICTVPHADLMASVRGEADPATIPAVEGQQAMILWPMAIAGRSWDSGFFGPILMSLPPRVTVTSALSVEEVREWRTRLNLPELTKKAWWKFW